MNDGEYFGSVATGKKIGESSAAARCERPHQGPKFKYEASSFSHYLSAANRAAKGGNQGSQRPSRVGSGRRHLPVNEDSSSYVDEFGSSAHAPGASNGAKHPNDSGGQGHTSIHRQEPFTFSNSLQYSERKADPDSSYTTPNPHVDERGNSQTTSPYNTNAESQQTVAAVSLYTPLENSNGHAEKIL